MIRNDEEYKKSVARIRAEEERIQTMQQNLAAEGFTPEEVARLIAPVESFHLQLKEEVISYEKLKRGEFDDLRNLRGLGHLLVCLRIATGITQRELANRLNVKETQVSRDERNEYHGITLDRASRVLDALGVSLSSVVHIESGYPDLEHARKA